MNGTKFVNGQQVKAKKVVEKKEPKAKAKPVEKKVNNRSTAAIAEGLIAGGTDEEIMERIKKDKRYTRKNLSIPAERCWYNKNGYPGYPKPTKPLVRLVRDPSGKLVPWQPKAKIAKAKIAGTAADPLVKAGVIKKEKSTTTTKS
jgi:hypothetical protein